MKITRVEHECALDRLRADMANQKIWLFALIFGAIVTGITQVLTLSG